MNTYEIKSIEIKSLLKSFPIIAVIMGVIIGAHSFFISTDNVASNLSVGERLISWMFFVVFYTLVMITGFLLISWLYNVVASKMGGIVIQLERKEFDNRSEQA